MKTRELLVCAAAMAVLVFQVAAAGTGPCGGGDRPLAAVGTGPCVGGDRSLAAAGTGPGGGVSQAGVVVEPESPDEKWWGATTFFGGQQPYGTTPRRDLAVNNFFNPAAPLFVSSKGRYVWSDRPFAFAFTNGVLYVEGVGAEELEVKTAPEKTLRGAFRAAAAAHFPASGRMPEELFFAKPQFNTWVESKMVGNGEKMVSGYVDAILANRFPCGVFMIDEGWAPTNRYGDAAFNMDLFPHAKELFAKTRAKGFKTLLWTTPYVAQDCDFYRDGLKENLFVLNRETGKPANLTYFPGLWTCGLLNLFDRVIWDRVEKHYKDFMADAGFDGYKFDFTDAFCVTQHTTKEKCRHLPDGKKPIDYTGLWGDFAQRFPFHELRAGWKYGGKPLVVRLQDKEHSWKDLRLLVPDMISAGLVGCPFTCPDMIGGGTVAGGFDKGVDHKLFVRSAQVQALMPMMQFSAAPWRLLTPDELAICRDAANLHVAFAPEILRLARHAAKTGEPIVRAMEYEFPGEGLGECLQQFMLGDRWLVAPVVTPDDRVTVRLPRGAWRDDLGATHVGPKTLELKDVPLSRLPRFERGY